LHLVDEHKILYTAGHNITVYSTDEKIQHFLNG
jgi:WD40 repeat protein